MCKDSKSSKLLQKPKKEKKEKFPEYEKYQAYIKSEDWKKIRELVLERDNYHCMCCGRNYKDDNVVLSIHHNNYDNLFDEANHLDDLVTLCKVCHASVHRNRANWQRFKKKPSK